MQGRQCAEEAPCESMRGTPEARVPVDDGPFMSVTSSLSKGRSHSKCVSGQDSSVLAPFTEVGFAVNVGIPRARAALGVPAARQRPGIGDRVGDTRTRAQLRRRRRCGAGHDPPRPPPTGVHAARGGGRFPKRHVFTVVQSICHLRSLSIMSLFVCWVKREKIQVGDHTRFCST